MSSNSHPSSSGHIPGRHQHHRDVSKKGDGTDNSGVPPSSLGGVPSVDSNALLQQTQTGWAKHATGAKTAPRVATAGSSSLSFESSAFAKATSNNGNKYPGDFSGNNNPSTTANDSPDDWMYEIKEGSEVERLAKIDQCLDYFKDHGEFIESAEHPNVTRSSIAAEVERAGGDARLADTKVWELCEPLSARSLSEGGKARPAKAGKVSSTSYSDNRGKKNAIPKENTINNSMIVVLFIHFLTFMLLILLFIMYSKW